MRVWETGGWAQALPLSFTRRVTGPRGPTAWPTKTAMCVFGSMQAAVEKMYLNSEDLELNSWTDKVLSRGVAMAPLARGPPEADASRQSRHTLSCGEQTAHEQGPKHAFLATAEFPKCSHVPSLASVLFHAHFLHSHLWRPIRCLRKRLECTKLGQSHPWCREQN